MKKIFLKMAASSLMLVWLVLFVPVIVAEAETASESDFVYTLSPGGSEATITGYRGNGGNVVIPSTLGGGQVVEINEKAFMNNNSITDVTIPGCVRQINMQAFSSCFALQSVTILKDAENTYGTIIYDYAFAECRALTSIVIPDSVTEIGNRAFLFCSSLQNVLIGNGVTLIGEEAFNQCISLKEITIPESVVKIGLIAFVSCHKLEAINVAGNNQNFASIDGVLFNKDKTELISFPNGKQGVYTIPDGVLKIHASAFFNNEGLTGIVLPNSLQIIEENAFTFCTALEHVTFGSSLQSIGQGAFASTLLTTVDIPNGVVSIGSGAFSNTPLVNIHIPKSVASLGTAFTGCKSLVNVTVDKDNASFSGINGVLFNRDKTQILFFPNGKKGTYTIPASVKMIADHAFSDSTGLTAVSIPNSVTSIGYSAFYGCKALKSVRMGTGVKTIDFFAFYECTSLKSVTIPSRVTSIGGSAFSRCTLLESMTIPNSVTSIGVSAFDSCPRLTIHCRSNSAAHRYARSNRIKFKLAQNTPSRPRLRSKSYNSITLMAVSGLEYSRDGRNWQSSAIFRGLAKYRKYGFYVRRRATSIYDASAKSAVLYVYTYKGITPRPNSYYIPANRAVRRNTGITLKAPRGMTLYYTINGARPTTKSRAVRSGKKVTIRISRRTILRVIAVKAYYVPSSIISRTYRLR